MKGLDMLEISLTRGTGRSTSQIINAPINSIYVCRHYDSVNYHKRIAAEVNRPDIIFISITDIMMGRHRSHYSRRYIEIDHYAYIHIPYKCIDEIDAINSQLNNLAHYNNG
jgi:hypothetical protein